MCVKKALYLLWIKKRSLFDGCERHYALCYVMSLLCERKKPFIIDHTSFLFLLLSSKYVYSRQISGQTFTFTVRFETANFINDSFLSDFYGFIGPIFDDLGKLYPCCFLLVAFWTLLVEHFC